MITSCVMNLTAVLRDEMWVIRDIFSDRNQKCDCSRSMHFDSVHLYIATEWGWGGGYTTMPACMCHLQHSGSTWAWKFHALRLGRRWRLARSAWSSGCVCLLTTTDHTVKGKKKCGFEAGSSWSFSPLTIIIDHTVHTVSTHTYSHCQAYHKPYKLKSSNCKSYRMGQNGYYPKMPISMSVFFKNNDVNWCWSLTPSSINNSRARMSSTNFKSTKTTPTAN